MALVGCSSPQESERGQISPDNPLRVVATTSLIADLVSQIGGAFVDVEGLMGPGVDPHLYKASEGDVSLMTRADLIFYNGMHLEGKMVDIFEQMHSRGAEVHAVTAGVEESTGLVTTMSAVRSILRGSAKTPAARVGLRKIWSLSRLRQELWNQMAPPTVLDETQIN